MTDSVFSILVSRKHRLYPAVALPLLTCVALSSPPTQAQGAVSSDTSQAKRGSGGALEEVVVTARRRAESLQDAPLSITALSGDAPEVRMAQDLRDLAGIAPNTVITSVPGFNAAAIGMRGASTGDIILTFDPAVGIVVDGVVLAHVQTQLLDMFDIESIEMLRGPQGTLFGKNTVGGAINVTTRRPDFEGFSGEGRLLAGKFGREEARGTLNVPLSDTLAARMSLLYQKSDGFYENTLGNGEDLGGDDVFSGRLKLLWQPDANTEVLLSGEYLKDEGDAPPSVNETPEDFLFAAIGFPGISTTGRDPFNTGMTLCEGDRFDADCVGVANGHEVEVKSVTLNVDHSFSAGTATVIANARNQVSILPSDFSGEAERLFESTRDDERNQYSLEARFASELNGPFNFVAGGLYWVNNLDWYESSTFLSFLRFVGDPTATSDPNIGFAKQDVTSYALFGEAEYEFSSSLTGIFGARYTFEEKDFERRPQVRRSLLDQQPTFVEDEDFDAITTRLGLRYDVSDDIQTYATFSQGFKSGGFNSQAASLASSQPFEEETAESYEIGAKGEFLDSRVRLNAALFFVEYDDLQRDAVVPFTDPLTGLPGQETVTTNAGGSEVWGVELEGSAIPIPGLTLQLSLSYQDAEYTEFETDIDGDLVNEDASFLDLTRTPELTAFASANYSLQSAVGDFDFNVSANYQDEYESTVLNSDFTQGEERTLVHASVRWIDTANKLSVSVFGRNLGDEVYRVSGSSVAGLWAFAAYGAPRTYGVEIGYKF